MKGPTFKERGPSSMGDGREEMFGKGRELPPKSMRVEYTGL